jgi:hypothetical protein
MRRRAAVETDAQEVPVAGARGGRIERLLLAALALDQRQFRVVAVERREAQHHDLAGAVRLARRAGLDVVAGDEAKALATAQQVRTVGPGRGPAHLIGTPQGRHHDFGVRRQQPHFGDRGWDLVLARMMQPHHDRLLLRPGRRRQRRQCRPRRHQAQPKAHRRTFPPPSAQDRMPTCGLVARGA